MEGVWFAACEPRLGAWYEPTLARRLGLPIGEGQPDLEDIDRPLGAQEPGGVASGATSIIGRKRPVRS
jgi:hypothetical protein